MLSAYLVSLWSSKARERCPFCTPWCGVSLHILIAQCNTLQVYQWLGLLQEILQTYEPRASLVPATLHFGDCPFMWPFCRQPLYAGAMPLMFNATVLNGMGLTGLPIVHPTVQELSATAHVVILWHFPGNVVALLLAQTLSTCWLRR